MLHANILCFKVNCLCTAPWPDCNYIDLERSKVIISIFLTKNTSLTLLDVVVQLSTKVQFELTVKLAFFHKTALSNVFKLKIVWTIQYSFLNVELDCFAIGFVE